MRLRVPAWAGAALWIGLICGVSLWLHTHTNLPARQPVLHTAQVASRLNVPPRDESAAYTQQGEVTTETVEVEVARNAADPSPEPLTKSQAVESATIEPAALLADVSGRARLDRKDWDLSEFERLAAPAYETTDTLSQLAVGSVVTPPQTLSVEELLAANRTVEPIGYGAPSLGTGIPFRIGTGTPGEAAVPPGPVPDGKIEIESTDFLDYDQEHNQVYGQGRIVLRFGQYKLEANRVLVDTRLQEVQAYGKVILTSPNEYIEAESLWFDALHKQGVGYTSRGHTGDFYVLAGDPHEADGTHIHQVSEGESVFKDSSFTMCDFPVPHYRMRAKQFTLVNNERIFAQNAVLYIWECPVLWLPFFTRALQDDNPFGITAGTDSELGFFVRLFYDYHHSCYTPSDVDDRIMIRASSGQARLRLDFMSDRGFGEGLEYNYNFDYGRHFGKLNAYHITDSERNIDGEEGSDRSYVDWFHRTRITDELDFLADVNYASDPDIFYDILDRLRGSGESRYGRIPERSVDMGLEWTCDDFFAGIHVELRDRIGRNRVSNFSEFHDGDFDFDRRFNDEGFFTLLGPGVGPDGNFYPNAGIYTDPSTLDDTIDEGVASSRYGRVTERLPHLRVASNRMRLWCLPLWYHVDLNVFNNLDKGLNIVSEDDDSFVHGFDLYQSISHLAKFCERYTLLTKFGVGMGVAEREDDSFNLDFPSGASFPFVYDGQLIDGEPLGLTFVDEDTFLVGKRKMSLSDVEPAFVYGDIDSRFNARISECVNAFVRYRFREGTDNNLGTFYESIGARKSMDDLYPFRTPEHWIEAGAHYNLDSPRLSIGVSTARNLQGEEDITPNELLGYHNLSVSYTNLCNTLVLSSGVGFQDRQMRDPTDPNEFIQNAATYHVTGSYMPIHQRYWTRLSAFFIDNQSQDPLGVSGEDSRDLDTRNETILDYTIGRKIGQKYLVEFRSKMRTQNTQDEDTYITVERDFHDMIAGLSVGIMSEDRLSNDDEETEKDNFQIRFNVRFKPSSEKGVAPSVVRSSKLYNANRVSGFERGG